MQIEDVGCNLGINIKKLKNASDSVFYMDVSVRVVTRKQLWASTTQKVV